MHRLLLAACVTATSCSQQPVAPPPPPRAVAAALCDAFQELPRRRAAECGGRRIGPRLTAECTRRLDASLTSGALSVDAARAERCVADVYRAYAGCGAVAEPRAPASCISLFTGHVAAGGACASALECAADLRCEGVSPGRRGVCAEPGVAGVACDTGVDPLQSYVPQQDVSHASCAGFCAGARCWPVVAQGGACASDEQCGADRRCAARRCARQIRSP